MKKTLTVGFALLVFGLYLGHQWGQQSNHHQTATLAVVNNTNQELPSVIIDSGYLLVKVSSPTEAFELMTKHDKLSRANGSILHPAGVGNVMDNPDRFTKTIELPLAFSWGGDKLAFLKLKKDKSGYEMVESVPNRPVYLLFWNKT